MPFAWLSDDFYDHPKVRALPRRYRNEAVGLFTRLVTLCNRHLTDGVITEADIEVCDGNQRLVDLLLEAPHGFKVGLIEQRRGKLRIHDFHKFNRTKRQVVSERKKKAEAGRKGGLESGKRRRSKRRSEPEAPASPLVEPRTPSPSPSPSVPRESTHYVRTLSARDGLPHITEEVQATGERIAGHAILTAPNKELTELDRLCEDHGAPNVVSAMEAVANGRRKSWRQLVWDSMKRLEPFEQGRRTDEDDVADLARRAREQYEKSAR